MEPRRGAGDGLEGAESPHPGSVPHPCSAPGAPALAPGLRVSAGAAPPLRPRSLQPLLPR